jgi:hypothetical protein
MEGSRGSTRQVYWMAKAKEAGSPTASSSRPTSEVSVALDYFTSLLYWCRLAVAFASSWLLAVPYVCRFITLRSCSIDFYYSNLQGAATLRCGKRTKKRMVTWRGSRPWGKGGPGGTSSAAPWSNTSSGSRCVVYACVYSIAF